MVNLALFELIGVLAALWMLAGVVLVARRFPGYSHRHQVMSELGARGRPTAAFHPLVNNYPIAALFIIFGIRVVGAYGTNGPMLILGILILIHGVSHIVTGLYPCDEDLGLTQPSATQVIHNIAGVVMLVSLFAACAVGGFSASVEAPSWFRGFSVACLVVCVSFSVLMARSLVTGYNTGLYQRLAYGALLVWVSIFSGIVYNNSSLQS